MSATRIGSVELIGSRRPAFEINGLGTAEILGRQVSDLAKRVAKLEREAAPALDLDVRREMRTLSRKIIVKVCAESAVAAEDVCGPSRRREIADVRHLIAYLLIVVLRYQYRIVEEALGLNPKASFYMTKRVPERMEVEPEFRKTVERWSKKLRGEK